MEKLHCQTHDLPATHCAPNGDDLVCEKYATEGNGCNCCPENYNRGEKNQVLYKAAWDSLTDEQQTAIRNLVEARESE
jgi:hypothetical protein